MTQPLKSHVRFSVTGASGLTRGDPACRQDGYREVAYMGFKLQSSSSNGSSGNGSSSNSGGLTGLMPSQSRISAWFAALVVLAGSVFLLEYVVFFTSDSSSDHGGGGGRPPGQSRPTPAKPRPQLQVEAETPVAPPPPSSLPVVALQEGRGRRLAVVVPSHAGDLGKALSSLATWPTRCHESTLVNTDLVLYYAGGEEDDVAAVLPSLARTGGKCFANTRLVLANLTEEVSRNRKSAGGKGRRMIRCMTPASLSLFRPSLRFF